MMRNRAGEYCVFAPLYNLIVVKADIANYFSIGMRLIRVARSYIDL